MGRRAAWCTAAEERPFLLAVLLLDNLWIARFCRLDALADVLEVGFWTESALELWEEPDADFPVPAPPTASGSPPAALRAVKTAEMTQPLKKKTASHPRLNFLMPSFIRVSLRRPTASGLHTPPMGRTSGDNCLRMENAALGLP